MFPPKLKRGDGVRIIAPARSLSLPWMSEELKTLAEQRLTDLGLRVTFGRHVFERDAFDSTTIEYRIEDLHAAFADDSVQLVLTVIGGFNSNQLLRSVDYELLRTHPKILCGYSDITALATAIYAKTGMVTYSGPHFINFGQRRNFEYTEQYFRMCLFENASVDLAPSATYIDGPWATRQNDIEVWANPGWETIREGRATGRILGGNLGTLHLLHGTEYMPHPEEDIILFLEDDRDDDAVAFDRNLQSLLHQPIAPRIRGIVFGRCERESGMTNDVLQTIVESKSELRDIPVICGVDFGHTTPMITFPIGGRAEMAAGLVPFIRITEH